MKETNYNNVRQPPSTPPPLPCPMIRCRCAFIGTHTPGSWPCWTPSSPRNQTAARPSGRQSVPGAPRRSSSVGRRPGRATARTQTHAPPTGHKYIMHCGGSATRKPVQCMPYPCSRWRLQTTMWMHTSQQHAQRYSSQTRRHGSMHKHIINTAYTGPTSSSIPTHTPGIAHAFPLMTSAHKHNTDTPSRTRMATTGNDGATTGNDGQRTVSARAMGASST